MAVQNEMLIMGIPHPTVSQNGAGAQTVGLAVPRHQRRVPRKNIQNEKLRSLVRQGAIQSQQYPVVLYPTSTGLMQEPSKRDFVIDSLKGYRKQVAIGVVPSVNDHFLKDRNKRLKGGNLGFSRLTDLSKSDINRQGLAASARLNRSYQLSDEASHLLRHNNASRELSLDFGPLDGSQIDYVSHF